MALPRKGGDAAGQAADNPGPLCQSLGVRPLPPPSPRPFTIAIDDARRRGAALCLHGYTGTPYEVRVLANDLAATLDLATHAPLLPGHGDDPAVLNAVRAEDWLDATLAAWDHLDVIDPPRLDGTPRPRVLVGSSMGGLLALQLCLRRRVDVLVLLAPALRLTDAATIGVAAMALGLWRARAFLPKESPGGDVLADDAQRNNPTYKVLPTRGLTELLRLQFMTERRLSEVTTPICLFHGDADHTITPSSSRIIARRVSSPIVEHHRLKRTQHLVGLDVDRDVVSRLGCQFVARALAAPEHRAP